MKYLNALLFIFMLLFIGVQYNDPDGAIWMAIYAVPAIWAAIAAFKPHWLLKSLPSVLLLASLVAGIVGTVYFWPNVPNWWVKSVWMEEEAAREGMGLIIASIVMLIVWVTKVLTSSKFTPLSTAE